MSTISHLLGAEPTPVFGTSIEMADSVAPASIVTDPHG